MTNDSYYLRSPEEMATIFSEIPEALSNTLLIAERCNVDLGFKGYHLPEFDVPGWRCPNLSKRSVRQPASASVTTTVRMIRSFASAWSTS